MTREQALLTILSEECMEVAQRATKAIRFGIQEVQPEQELSNEDRLIYEYNDLIAVMEMLVDEGFINRPVINQEAIAAKKIKVEHFLQYSKKLGQVV